MELKIGDVVQLKSGGPRMTIEQIYETDVECVWFEKDKPHRHSFNAALLVPAGSGIGFG